MIQKILAFSEVAARSPFSFFSFFLLWVIKKSGSIGRVDEEVQKMRENDWEIMPLIIPL